MRSTFVIRLAVLLALSGCSVLLTRGPSNGDTTPAPAVAGQQAPPPPSCTTSMTWPAIDAILAGVFTIATFTTISDNKMNTINANGETSRDGDVAASIILAGAAGVSAFIGHTRVSKCRRATEAYTASYYGQQQPQYAYPQQYPAQPQYQYPQQYPQQYPPPQQGYPQQYPAAPQQYPTAQPPVQPAAPVVAPMPPSRQPAPPVARPPAAPPAVAKQPAAPKAPPPKAPAPKAPPDAVLGTEGDVCTTQSECANGYSCTGNVCLKAK